MLNEMPKYFHVNTDLLSDQIKQYVSNMEVQRTNEWCACEWIVHPEDTELDIYNCATCHHPRAFHTEMEGMEGCTKIVTETDPPNADYAECSCKGWIDPPKRRLRRGDTNPLCPVHTKEGFLFGFFEWMFKLEKKDPSIETHEFISNPKAGGLVPVCQCGKWSFHHAHTGNRIACLCKECSDYGH